ncbi:hypothetical protein VKT23_016678 [Stygiomarasmius scandens]|uniref:Uncharacterized protein n=1 Tax=Marasmiellus scandens TaxID=2682957 RepID=A0ABR1IVU1_9AGAR
MSLLFELISTRLELTGNAEVAFLLEAGATEEQLQGLLEDRKTQRPKWHKKLRNAKYYEQWVLSCVLYYYVMVKKCVQEQTEAA